jgi:hypothetical protein
MISPFSFLIVSNMKRNGGTGRREERNEDSIIPSMEAMGSRTEPNNSLDSMVKVNI